MSIHEQYIDTNLLFSYLSKVHGRYFLIFRVFFSFEIKLKCCLENGVLDKIGLCFEEKQCQ